MPDSRRGALCYRCDYCGQFTPTREAHLRYVFASWTPLEDGSFLVYPGTYCSNYCASRAARVPTISRG